MSWTDALPFVTAFFALCVSVGGLLALRQGYAKRVGDIQEKVIAAQKAQNEIQKEEIAICQKEIRRLKQVLAALQYAFKRRGISIEIDGESITLIDEQQSKRRTIHIPMKEGETTEKDI